MKYVWLQSNLYISVKYFCGFIFNRMFLSGNTITWKLFSTFIINSWGFISISQPGTFQLCKYLSAIETWSQLSLSKAHVFLSYVFSIYLIVFYLQFRIHFYLSVKWSFRRFSTQSYFKEFVCYKIGLFKNKPTLPDKTEFQNELCKAYSSLYIF